MPYTRSGRRYKGRRTTRRMGARRLSRARYTRPSMTRGKAFDELRVYADPFSIATSNPKIPDGKATSSAGIKLQAVDEFVNDGSGEMQFILFAGINCGVIGYSIANDTLNFKTLRYSNHIAYGPGTATGEITVIPGSNKISKWRCVSQGVRFSLVNNSDENDGWWEAIRWSPREDKSDFDLLIEDDGTRTPVPRETIASGNLVEHPSYTTGKLRDIDKFLFQLRANTDDHEFHRIRDTYNDGPNEDSLDIQEDLIDHSYDFIYLKIHGRPSADGNPPSRVMAHCVCNQELIYDESSFLKRFQTETNATTSFGLLKNQLSAQNPKAGKKRKIGND